MENLILTFGSFVGLFLMSILPIFYGSIRARKVESSQKETMERSEVLMYPVIMSVTLFGFYMLFKFFNPDMINTLLSFYFLAIGFYSISEVVKPIIKLPFGKSGEKVWFTIKISEKVGKLIKSITFGNFDLLKDKKERDLEIKYFDVLAYIIGIGMSFAYFFTKNWILSNIYGEALVVVFLENGDLGSFKNGAILLSLLFFYDILAVFGTDVMVTVAKKFDGPVKLLMPKAIDDETGKFIFSMIGLGDLVIPGIFISLMLEFDYYICKKENKKRKKHYFYTCFAFYIVGWISAIVAVNVFKVGQPALLYLVPCCLLSVIALSIFKGHFKELMKFESEEEKAKKKREKEQKEKELEAKKKKDDDVDVKSK